MRKIAVALVAFAALLVPVAVASAAPVHHTVEAPVTMASAYGDGAFTYNEFLRVRIGNSRTYVHNICGCNGTEFDTSPTDGRYSVRYDSWATNGYVQVYYNILGGNSADWAYNERAFNSDGSYITNPYFNS